MPSQQPQHIRTIKWTYRTSKLWHCQHR